MSLAADSGADGDSSLAAGAATSAAAATVDDQVTTAGDGGDGRSSEQALKEELAKTEDEVATLKQVLMSKQRRAAELRKKLNISVVTQIKGDVQGGFKSLSESQVVDKTRRAVLELGAKIEQWPALQKTNSAFKSVGESLSNVGRKIGGVKDSSTVKLIQQKVGGAYNTIKVKVTGKESEQPSDSASK